MARKNLDKAKLEQNDEYYTQFQDISNEMNAYVEFDSNVFRGKTILLPCDDPEWSNFTKYFALKFEEFGIKKLISTSYAPESKKMVLGGLFSEWEKESPQFDADKSKTHGKIFILERDITGDGRINIDDLEWGYLEGDGDFRSEEVTRLRNEADIIVTNPPFSLFREFMQWVISADKKFILIANKNCITYKEIFPLIKENKLWCGKTNMSKDLLFIVPPAMEELFLQTGKEGSKYKIINGKVLGRSPSVWITNIEHGKRHEPMVLMTMEDNLRYSKHKEIREKGYPKYDNYNAIHIAKTDAIPSDYNDLMGVPISWLGKYCPEQFEIIGLLQSSTEQEAGIPILREYGDFLEMRQNMTYTGSKGSKANGNPVLKGKSEKGNFLYNPITGEFVHSAFARILIRKKNDSNIKN